MSFWDSSAIVALLVHEPASHAVDRLMRAEHSPVVWWGSLVECSSALERRRRAGQLTHTDLHHSGQLLGHLATAWSEIQPTDLLRGRALRLLSSHDLRAADALQLAAALVWAEEQPSGRVFICLDGRLREAATQNGFLVLPEADNS